MEKMYQLVKILPVLVITIDMIWKLYRLMKNNNLGKGSVVTVAGFLVFMWYFYEKGIGYLYELFDQANLGRVGAYLGLILLPVGYKLTRYLTNRSVGTGKMTAEMRLKFETVMSMTVYPAGTFLVFLVGYVLATLVA